MIFETVLDVLANVKLPAPVKFKSVAVIAAVLSSNEDESIPQNYCFAAEVGLGGELRSVTRIDQRIAEAEKLGFKEIWISKYNLK